MQFGVAIVGSGNIGTDLLLKVHRSPLLTLVGVAGIDSASAGLARARELGYSTHSRGLDELLDTSSEIDLVFDATSATAHRIHAPTLASRGIRCVDLTPAALGPSVVPGVNLESHLDKQEINLITCGAQATVPVVHAVSRRAEVAYAEIVSTISASSAGPGTRGNIDEFTVTTARSLERIGEARLGKALMVLNPAKPPIAMRNTIYLETAGGQDSEVREGIREAVSQIKRYVPGYRLLSEPLVKDGVWTIFIEVTGAGDHLPLYAGNLDIMTAAAVRVAETMAEHTGYPVTT